MNANISDVFRRVFFFTNFSPEFFSLARWVPSGRVGHIRVYHPRALYCCIVLYDITSTSLVSCFTKYIQALPPAPLLFAKFLAPIFSQVCCSWLLSYGSSDSDEGHLFKCQKSGGQLQVLASPSKVLAPCFINFSFLLSSLLSSQLTPNFNFNFFLFPFFSVDWWWWKFYSPVSQTNWVPKK